MDLDAKVVAWDYGDIEHPRRLEIDYGARTVSVLGIPLKFTTLEFDFLEFLTLNEGAVCTKRSILRHIYGDHPPDIKIIDVMICHIRKKLTPVLGQNVIETYWGRGTRFIGTRAAETKPVVPRAQNGNGIRSRPIITLHGAVYTAIDLPPTGVHVRWTIRNKELVLASVEGGIVSKEEVLTRYPGLTKTEFESWVALYKQHGLAGLRATHAQDYLHT